MDDVLREVSLDQDSELDPVTGLVVGKLVNYVEAGWPDKVSLVGKIVRLEALDPDSHSSSLWVEVGGFHHAALWQYMSEGPFSLQSDFDEAMQTAAEHDDPVFYAIVDQKTNRAVGRCAYLNIRPKYGTIEVGHLLFSPALQRTRAATEALYLLAKYAFDELGYRRYEWKCNALNQKSRRAAERLGFVYEGTFRHHLIVKGRNRDSAWFSMLIEEWPGVKQAYEAWLANDNFDEHGNQLRKLDEFMPGRKS